MSTYSKSKKLTRTFGHRKALLRNMLSSLIMHESIRSTGAKIHVLKPLAEKIISRAKKNDLTARRLVSRYVNDKQAIKKLFEVLVPRYANRVGGYVRVFRLGQRLTDNADMALIKLLS